MQQKSNQIKKSKATPTLKEELLVSSHGFISLAKHTYSAHLFPIDTTSSSPDSSYLPLFFILLLHLPNKAENHEDIFLPGELDAGETVLVSVSALWSKASSLLLLVMAMVVTRDWSRLWRCIFCGGEEIGFLAMLECGGGRGVSVLSRWRDRVLSVLS